MMNSNAADQCDGAAAWPSTHTPRGPKESRPAPPAASGLTRRGPVERKKQNRPLPQKQGVHGANSVEVKDVRLAGLAPISTDSAQRPPAIRKEHGRARTPAKPAARQIRLQSLRFSEKRQTCDQERQAECRFPCESMPPAPAAKAPASQASRAVAAYRQTQIRLTSTSAVVIKSNPRVDPRHGFRRTPLSPNRSAPRQAGRSATNQLRGIARTPGNCNRVQRDTAGVPQHADLPPPTDSSTNKGRSPPDGKTARGRRPAQTAAPRSAT